VKTDFNTLKITIADGIAELILHRPEKRNAISHEMQAEIDVALDEAEVDPDVKVVVLRGEGLVFTAGHDMHEHYSGKTFPALMYPNASPSIGPSLPRAWYFRKPLIGVAHRYVGPYGSALLACCDFNIAAEGTQFGFEVYNKGGSPGNPFLPLYVQFPMRVIEKLFLMGGWMSAETALQFQFVQRVVAEDQVLEEAMRWAQQLTLADPDVFSYGKERIRRSVELLGLSALSSVLMPYGPAYADASAEAGMAASAGVAAATKLRNEGHDPEIGRV
jgi:enoyl-CoA hydratase